MTETAADPIATARSETSAEVRDETTLLTAVLARDEAAWREFVTRYQGELRTVVRDATDAIYPIADDQIGDVMGTFWVAMLANDMRLLRAFNPARSSSLLTWLTFHLAHVAHEYARRLEAEPPTVPLDEAVNVPAPWPRPTPARRPEPRRPKLSSGRHYSPSVMALLEDFAAFLARLACDGKLDDFAVTDENSPPD